MRKWSKQGFLNPADSNDDGWYKFSIRPKKSKSSVELDIQYIISDCSNKIYLEFEPDCILLEDNGGMRSPERYTAVMKSIEARRKKNRLFADAVAKAAEQIEKALDEYEEEVIRALDRGTPEE